MHQKLNHFATITHVLRLFKGRYVIFFIFFIFAVCSDDEMLVGENCVFTSVSPGDVLTKDECSAYIGSFHFSPFMLLDNSLLFSKSAFITHALVSLEMLIVKSFQNNDTDKSIDRIGVDILILILSNVF